MSNSRDREGYERGNDSCSLINISLIDDNIPFLINASKNQGNIGGGICFECDYKVLYKSKKKAYSSHRFML